MLEQIAVFTSWIVGPHLLEKLTCGGRFDVKAAHRLAAAQKITSLVILQRLPGRIIDFAAGVLSDGFQSVTDDGEATVAEDIYLCGREVMPPLICLLGLFLASQLKGNKWTRNIVLVTSIF